MKVWLYYRLSRDEDEELNSLMNQRKIIYDYAVSQGHEIVGESFDDNVSGMHFNREGINKIYEVVDAGLIEAVIVKDLSRLGRHRTQTALFIDCLRENNVRVLSATENIDTFNENDDLVIGFKGLLNDFYARDNGRRVRTGYRQKQKEGIVTIPPFGYFKDKNTKQVVIVEEAAETVRLIYALYVFGSGMKAIARRLNEEKRKTPAQIQMELLRKRQPNTQDHIRKKYIWDSTMVSRILRDESYIGTLICHKSERNKINKTFRFTEPEEQFRHENFFPPIVSKNVWQEVQNLLAQRKDVNVRAGEDRPILRYSGLLRCDDCGRTFVGKRVKLKERERVEYICDTYLRYGKEHCSSHVIREELLDYLIMEELKSTKRMYEQNWNDLQKMLDHWMPQKVQTAEQLRKLNTKIGTLEEEMEVILMERIRDKANAERYDRMIQKREEEITAIKRQISELENLDAALKKRQARPTKGNQAKHRYAGLLTYQECGNVFIPMIRHWNGKRRVEYVCRGYHRNGKAYCSSHRIHEEVLDAAVQEYAEAMREQYAAELKQLAQMQKMWALRKPVLDAHVLSLREKVRKLEQEIDEIVMEKISCPASTQK